MFVYVLDINNRPLMPTKRFGKVRRMLRDGKAKVVRREPFTIKLLYEPKTKIVQEVTLGVDTGSDKVGTAVITNDTVVYASEVQIRNDISKKMDARKACRRNRRNRKTRYRKPRFLNRGNSTKQNRFNPTMTSKINSHIREISKYNDEFALFVFNNRIENKKGSKQHDYDIIYGVMSDSIPTESILEYKLGKKTKEEVLNDFKKSTSMKQLSLHNQALCDILNLQEAYVLPMENEERKELNVDDYNR